MPYKTPLGPIYDSGDFPKMLSCVQALAEYDRFELEQMLAAVKEIKPAAKLETDDMPLAVLDGWLGEICRTRMLEDFPVAYAWPALLTAASVLVTAKLLPGARGGFETRANIYTGVIGPVQSGKSSAFMTAFYLLGIADHTLMHLKAGSAEGNESLRTALMTALASNGGNLPANLA